MNQIPSNSRLKVRQEENRTRNLMVEKEGFPLSKCPWSILGSKSPWKYP
jgi:hypothetical protein